MKHLLKRATAVLLILTAAACVTELKPVIDEFTWQSIEDQNFTEGVTISAFFRDISFLGNTKTPTLCYSATSKLSVSGNNVTITVDLTPSGSGTCAQQAGGVTYTGAVRNLSSGTYSVRIVQNVAGVGTTEFTETVKL